jgi:aspartate carbamoyltransferase catalytic subunit
VKGLTSVKGLGRDEILGLVEHASRLRDAVDRRTPVTPVLEGTTVGIAFFEPSTRTRLSFDLAAQRLGGHVITFNPATSSTEKGESLRDTVLTIAAIGAEILVVRHADGGVPDSVADWTGLAVVNAGDGVNEHPTQALLDVTTILRHFGRLEGLRMGVVGDIAHSRVANSLIHVMPTLGVDLRLVGPEAWLPTDHTLPQSSDLDAMLGDLDIVYLLRVQTERGGTISPEYMSRFQLNAARSARLTEGAVVMHPGPMNRGVEISGDIADSPRSLVVEQVRNGVPTRMAVLSAIAGGIT